MSSFMKQLATSWSPSETHGLVAFRVSLAAAMALSAAVGAGAMPAKVPRSSKAPKVAREPQAPAILQTLIFEEPLVALGKPAPKQAQSLAKALETYVKGGRLDALDPVETFTRTHPKNPWQMSLLVNIGLMHRHVGRVSAAVHAWERAWLLGQKNDDPRGRALAHRALGELLEVNAGLGRQQALEQWIKVAEGEVRAGLLTEKLSNARESLAAMQTSPEKAFSCGPTALAYLKARETPGAFADPHIQGMSSSEKGSSLAMNQAWAEKTGLKLQMAKRDADAEFPVPSVLHFRTGHFAAAMYRKDGRVLVQDPALGDVWIPQRVLEQEVSGYALIPAGHLPKGWTAVDKAEGGTVWGKGAWGPGRPDDTRPDSVRFASTLLPDRPGAIRHGFLPNLTNLQIQIPASRYSPTKGPNVDVTVVYNHREYGQPEVFDYCNLGPKWTFTFLACLKDDTANPDFNVTLCNPGGGGLVFQSRGDGTYLPEGYTQAQLIRLPNHTYVIEYLDGHKDYYEAADRAWGLRRVILTRRQDKNGLEAKFGWDAQLRLASITDADGQATLLSYEDPSDALKLTKVVDPRGRTTRFEYNELGRLIKTVDADGRASAFTYGPSPEDPGLPADFIRAMEMPEGLITFRAGEGVVGAAWRRWLEARSQDGRMERVESGAGYAYEIEPEQFPKVPEFSNDQHPLTISYRESFFWAAGAWTNGKPDYRKAHHLRWGHGPGGFSSGIVLSERAPGEPRHWYVHAGDAWGGVFPGAYAPSFPRTPEGLPRTGEALGQVLAPVYDGNRRLVTRDYWINPDGSLGSREGRFDVKGQPVEPSSTR